MMEIRNVINGIIFGKNYICCLCFKAVQQYYQVEDEIIVNINNYTSNKTVGEILSSVLGDDLSKIVGDLNVVCEQCTNTVISSYNFIKKCQNNMMYLTKSLNSLEKCFPSVKEEMPETKSQTLYLSYDMENLNHTKVYDTKQIKTPLEAINRFKLLEVNKKNKLDSLSSNIKHKRKKKIDKKCSMTIPTSEMLFDKNNCSLFKCKICLKVYPTGWNLRSHYIRMHAPKSFKCTDCSRQYGSLSLLQVHRETSHCTAMCSTCGRTFCNRQTLRVHEIGHNLSFICTDCGRVYKNKYTYKSHKDLNICGKITRAKPSEGKYTCDYCNKKYAQKVTLRVHIQYDHGNYKAHVCSWCGKKFWAQSRLKSHVLKHTGEKNFTCGICYAKFVSKESLLYHTRIHTGEKPYQCPECDERFLSASRRADHVKRQHTGGTLFCDICQCKFTNRNFLQKHKKCHNRSSEINEPYDVSKSKVTVTNTVNEKIKANKLLLIDSIQCSSPLKFSK